MTEPVTTSSFGPSALLTPANAITIARLLLTPVWLLVVVAQGPSWPSFGMGFVLAATDGVDGYIARRQGATRSGAFLDPLADKFLVIGGLTALVFADALWWLPVAIITARELLISAYRSLMGRRGVSIPARYWAKVKTVTQEVAIGFALLPLTSSVEWLPKGVLWIAVVITVVTGAQYLLDGRKAAAGAA
jgi:CDP-diacylglycerol---glycerol-3-phosphate 3-phosphatidyltransferase